MEEIIEPTVDERIEIAINKSNELLEIIANNTIHTDKLDCEYSQRDTGIIL